MTLVKVRVTHINNTRAKVLKKMYIKLINKSIVSDVIKYMLQN